YTKYVRGYCRAVEHRVRRDTLPLIAQRRQRLSVRRTARLQDSYHCGYFVRYLCRGESAALRRARNSSRLYGLTRASAAIKPLASPYHLMILLRPERQHLRIAPIVSFEGRAVCDRGP